MKTFVECVPCLTRQGYKALSLSTDDEKILKEGMKEVLKILIDLDYSLSPPQMATKMYRFIYDFTGNTDPFKEIKRKSNEMALKLYPSLRKEIMELEDSCVGAVKLATMANIIDWGPKHSIDEQEVIRDLKGALDIPCDQEALYAFKKAVAKANSILYIADNAGEIVFDKLLIELLGSSKVTLVVRGKAVLNDVTREDAKLAGLDGFVNIIDTGNFAPGIVFEDISEEFLQHLKNADLIISKGQGNYEALSDTDRPIVFLLRVKCGVIARDIGYDIGEIVVLPRNVERGDIYTAP